MALKRIADRKRSCDWRKGHCSTVDKSMSCSWRCRSRPRCMALACTDPPQRLQSKQCWNCQEMFGTGLNCDDHARVRVKVLRFDTFTLLRTNTAQRRMLQVAGLAETAAHALVSACTGCKKPRFIISSSSFCQLNACFDQLSIICPR